MYIDAQISQDPALGVGACVSAGDIWMINDFLRSYCHIQIPSSSPFSSSGVSIPSRSQDVHLTTPSATAATITWILRRVVSQEQTMWQDQALWQDQRNSCCGSHSDVTLGLVTAPHPVGLLRRTAWRLRTRDRAEGWTSFSRRSSSCVGGATIRFGGRCPFGSKPTFEGAGVHPYTFHACQCVVIA